MRRSFAPAASSASTASLQTVQRRTYMPFVGPNRFVMPGQPIITKAQAENMKFQAKSREQWDYQGIDEKLTAQSTLNNQSRREEFDGPRPDNSTCFAGSLKNAPHFKRLHEYFDEYNKPGGNKSADAIRAVREHWDSENFYYPGESWQRNRPSFRSVPAELLNKQTWYHWTEIITKFEDISATTRHRAWNPIWPPPGYKVPKLWTKREFQFGVEEPGLLSEIERWYWHKQWFESNQRQGPWEALLWMLTLSFMYDVATRNEDNVKMKSMYANMYYPGRQCIRSKGEPRDWEKDNWWWQEPLETWPNQGEIWYWSEIRYKYINHIKKRDAEEALKAEMA